MATPASPPPATVVPAQLGFLAIFNPSLGTTDETIDDQIVYYASVNTHNQKRRHRSRGKPTDNISQDERNERLRQIGLAQGMVEFSRDFASGKPVDTIETEKGRVVLHELEPGWWILASIDLTKLPLPPRLGASAPSKKDDPSENVEYSSREIKPAALLMQDLLRAHSVFLLHHAASLSALFVKSKRSKFVNILSRYWDLYLSTWDVMLHGNPACNVFGGIKLAACGELGVGVGEEERGSGEREVLEGFVDRVEGLVDLIVSKFGPSDPEAEAETAKDKKENDDPSSKWLGTGEEPGAEDGVIFLGTGVLSRKSLRDVTYWMEDLYIWGEEAYGVKESPMSTRQSRRARKPTVSKAASGNPSSPSGPADSANAKVSGASSQPTEATGSETAPPRQTEDNTEEGGGHKLMSYLKMGYGTHWTLGSSEGAAKEGAAVVDDPQKHKATPDHSRRPSKAATGESGRYLIGLLGDVEEACTNERDESKEQSDDTLHDVEYNSRVLLRTLSVELDISDRPETEMVQDLGSQKNELTTTRSGRKDSMDPKSHFDSQDRNKSKKMRVVVYVNKPFVYTFLFQNRTDSLAWDGLYRSLHHQLAPLRRPLALSTAYRPGKPDVGVVASHIFDLVWDPKAMTIASTIPNIPSPAQIMQENFQPLWSRAEAISTHNQILNTYIATLTNYSELERTCKTNRGWWLVWTRILEKDTPNFQRTASDDSSVSGPRSERSEAHPIPKLNPEDSVGITDSQSSRKPKPKVSKEIFLVRRAGEHTGLRGISASYAERNGGWADGASRLAQGIGVDTHKYIENLLSLNR